MFQFTRIVCLAILSFYTAHKPVYLAHDREMVAPSPPPIYHAPPPAPPAPPTPIYIWINNRDNHNYGPRTDDYDGDGA
jgi:hypothetical protein